MGRNDRSKVPGVAQRPNYCGRLSPSAVTSQGQENGAGMLSLSLCPSDPDSYPINAAVIALAALSASFI